MAGIKNNAKFGYVTVAIAARLPAAQIVEAQGSVGEAYVDLYEIHLIPTGVLYLKNDNEVTWRGNTYESFALRITGLETNTDGAESKPKMQIVNPAQLFSSFIINGSIDKATVIRKRILRPHMLKNANIYQQRTWFISRVASMTSNSNQVVFELRELSDGPNFLVPARMYMPPVFPVVSLE
jgi:lambda family phage minor tail protein L